MGYRSLIVSQCFVGLCMLTIDMEHVEARHSTTNRLLDITNFRYSIAKTDCSMRQPNRELPRFVILVHSATTYFHRRLIIRETWGQERSVAKPKVYFLLGESNSTATQKLIEIEDDRHQDLIQGNFIDVYRNLTYKHTMALKWFKDNCAGIDFLVKTDDDVFVNIPPLFNYLALYTHSDVVVCQMNWDNRPLTFSTWAVTPEEYSGDIYPPYCRGYAIVYTRGVVERLYRQAQITRFFWIDDVQITGIVREKCNVTILNRGEDLHLYPNMDRFDHRDEDWVKRRNFIFQVEYYKSDLTFIWDGTRRFRTLQTTDD